MISEQGITAAMTVQIDIPEDISAALKRQWRDLPRFSAPDVSDIRS
jgi:hypothetical protein